MAGDSLLIDSKTGGGTQGMVSIVSETQGLTNVEVRNDGEGEG